MYSLRHFYSWMGNKVYSPYANFTLGFLFFLEAICFLPTDPMLVFYCVERPTHAFWFASVATFGSILGSLVSYAVGFTVWHYIGYAITHSSYLGYIMKAETFTYICEQFQLHDWFALLLAGFLPVPFKAVTFVAGFCKISLVTFIICVVITRAFRFYLIAGIIFKYGHYIKEIIDRYFVRLCIAALVCLLAAFFYFNIIKQNGY